MIISLNGGYSHRQHSTVGLSNGHRLFTDRRMESLMLLETASYFEELNVNSEESGRCRKFPVEDGLEIVASDLVWNQDAVFFMYVDRASRNMRVMKPT
jgi:hypothetical protein